MWVSLGHVTVAVPGTPERATRNELDPTRRYPANAVLIQQWPGNTGRVYFGTAAMNVAAGTGILATLAVPTANTLPSASATFPIPVGFDLSTYRIDADVVGEGPNVSALIW